MPEYEVNYKTKKTNEFEEFYKSKLPSHLKRHGNMVLNGQRTVSKNCEIYYNEKTGKGIASFAINNNYHVFHINNNDKKHVEKERKKQIDILFRKKLYDLGHLQKNKLKLVQETNKKLIEFEDKFFQTFNNKISPLSKKNYEDAVKRLKKTGLTPAKYASNKNLSYKKYLFYKSAYIRYIKSTLEKEKDTLKINVLDGKVDTKNIDNLLFEYKNIQNEKYYTHEAKQIKVKKVDINKDRLKKRVSAKIGAKKRKLKRELTNDEINLIKGEMGQREAWYVYKEKFNLLHKQKRKSKRKNLNLLPENWQSKVEDKIKDKYKDVVKVIHLTGCRPAEIYNNPINIYRTKNNKVAVEITGAKCVKAENVNNYNTKKYGKEAVGSGQERRIIYFDPNNPKVKDLVNTLISGDSVVLQNTFINKKENMIQVQLNNENTINALEMHYKRTTDKVFEDLELDSSISLYCSRHLLAAELKERNVQEESIAQIMGHQSTKMQSEYGLSGQGKGGNRGIVGVSATSAVRSTGRPFSSASTGPR